MSESTKERNWIESEIADDQFEVKVTVTLGFQYRGEHPGTRDSIGLFMDALAQRGPLPDGTLWYLSDARVHDAKDLRRRARKLAKEHPGAVQGETNG